MQCCISHQKEYLCLQTVITEKEILYALTVKNDLGISGSKDFKLYYFVVEDYYISFS